MQYISLLYHDVLPAEAGSHTASGFDGEDAAIYKLRLDAFTAHLNVIKNAPYPVLSNTAGAMSGTGIFLTFDDGGKSAYSVIAPLLEQYQWRGLFFITTGFIGEPGFLTADEILALHQKGHVIGSHSASHPARFSKLSFEEMKQEWQKSCLTLTKITGEPVTYASVPGGYYSKKVAEAAFSQGIKVLFNSEPLLKPLSYKNGLVLGRLNIQRNTSSAYIKRLVQGDSFLIFKQSFLWNLKKIFKVLGGRLWIAFRKKYFGATS
jgi:peptidoglycan/xylan/chitin deacetylase (PgdA/CDA1 family)